MIALITTWTAIEIVSFVVGLAVATIVWISLDCCLCDDIDIDGEGE